MRIMSFFSTIKPVLHLLPAEFAHGLAIHALRNGLVPNQPVIRDQLLDIEVAGIRFPNPVGLAAGFDKNAQTLDTIFDQGFGFVECGTVTPKAQPGNPKPRIFRIKSHEAVVNRLGFNNLGLVPFIANLNDYGGSGIVGANIGKNKDSQDVLKDYLTGLLAVYPYANYITVNISSPNTAGLRDLQAREALDQLIRGLYAGRNTAMAEGQPRKPIFIKIAPDLTEAQCESIAGLAMEHGLDGLIVSNTTVARPFPIQPHLVEGGLSGRPLFAQSTQILRQLYRLTNGTIPLIGVGGIASAEDAYTKIKAGASLVQVYTALVYQGFELISEINRGLILRLRRDGLRSIKGAVGAET
jgi:dihydroorotate dehydrogenase